MFLSSGSSSPLFLTPYIEADKIEEAQAKSRVRLYGKKLYGAPIHSGLITVNAKLNSNVFFLLVKAEKNASKAPLMVWLEGGPGATSLNGLFTGNGPIGIDANGKLFKRDPTISTHINVIYLDQPVGSGFSFTDGPRGYSRTLEDMGENIHEFLRQFLQLFPEYQNRELYLSGVSYGARGVVAMATRLLNPDDSPKINLDLRGALCGVPFLPPVTETVRVSDYYHQLGLVDANGRQILQEELSKIDALAQANRTLLALLRLISLVSGGPTSAITNLTGFESATALDPMAPVVSAKLAEYLDTGEFKVGVHLGVNASATRNAVQVPLYLADDFFRNAGPELEAVLNNLRVLVYVGQFDLIVPSPNIEDFVRSLNWREGDAFRAALSKPWYTKGFSGYVRELEEFVYVVVALSGHLVGLDVPAASSEMIHKFVYRISF